MRSGIDSGMVCAMLPTSSALILVNRAFVRVISSSLLELAVWCADQPRTVEEKDHDQGSPLRHHRGLLLSGVLSGMRDMILAHVFQDGYAYAPICSPNALCNNITRPRYYVASNSLDKTSKRRCAAAESTKRGKSSVRGWIQGPDLV